MGWIIKPTREGGQLNLAPAEQASYIFQLSLTDRSGIAVWESEYIVTKQGRKSAVTW